MTKKAHQRSPQKRNENRCKTENSGSHRSPQVRMAIAPDKRNSKQPLPTRIVRARVEPIPHKTKLNRLSLT